MNSWKMKRYARTAVTWLIVIFVGWSGVRLYQEGAFRSVVPAAVRVYGKLPIVGKYVRRMAYKKYRKGRRYRRGRSGVSRRNRRYRRSRRKRR